MTADDPLICKASGFYRGKVLKQLPHGKCKIFIPGVYDEVFLLPEYIDALPSAEPATPLFAGTNLANGVFSYPNLSSTVWCFFANNDQNQPVFFAATLGGPDAAHQYNVVNDNDEDDPTLPINSIMHRITAGETTLTLHENGILHAKTAYPLDTQTNHAKVTPESYSDLKMNESGSLTITTSNELLKIRNIVDIRSVDPPAGIQVITTSKEITSNLNMSTAGLVNLATTGNGVTCSLKMSIPDNKIIVDIIGSGGKSTVTLGGDGVTNIKASKEISLDAPAISLNGSTVSVSGSGSISLAGGSVSVSGSDISVSGGNVNIDGGGGDCVISGKSLTKHQHMGNMGAPTSPPL